MNSIVFELIRDEYYFLIDLIFLIKIFLFYNNTI